MASNMEQFAMQLGPKGCRALIRGLENTRMESQAHMNSFPPITPEGLAMTVEELREELAKYDGKQTVFVNLRSRDYPFGCQVIIQGVNPYSPPRGGVPDLIGIAAHAENRERSLWDKEAQS